MSSVQDVASRVKRRGSSVADGATQMVIADAAALMPGATSNAIPSLSTAFVPHPLLPSGQLQTLAGQVLGRLPPPLGSRLLEAPLPDGDRLVLHWEEAALPTRDGGRPLVMLMHGLGGDGDAAYLRRQSAKLNSEGCSALRFNHRGCGPGAAALANGIYHSARYGDIGGVLDFIAGRWPGRRVLLVGFSLSGNMLLRFLAETPAARYPHLHAALAVCPAIDLELCSLAITSRANRHIDHFYSFNVTRQIRAFELRQAPEQRRRLRYGLGLRAVDEAYTAGAAGFRSRADYYAQCSAKPLLSRIKTPTDILAAADDPIIPLASFAGLHLPSTVHLQLEAHGGHMGFIARAPTRHGDRRWLDTFVVDWALRHSSG